MAIAWRGLLSCGKGRCRQDSRGVSHCLLLEWCWHRAGAFLYLK